MQRALVLIAASLLAVVIASAAPLPRVVSVAPQTTLRGQTYRYILKENRNPEVCGHMLRVFNDKFTHLWDAPPMPWSKKNQDYAADSKYAFELLPGVEHSTAATFEMRFSAQPTSPEFSAIHWKEGRGIPGGCPAGETCPGEAPQPILVADFDIDNNGTIDTVIQQQFFGGYRRARDSQEYLIVWRSQNFTIRGVADIWKLEHPMNQALTPIISLDMYARPFIYAKQTYVARYVQDLGQSADLTSWTKPPAREDMLVQRYSFTGRKEKKTGRSQWTAWTVCDFRMKQVNGK
jgi:hypothetical protein